MAIVRVQAAASLRLDEIYRYTRKRWGAEQADRYIVGLFEAFDQIERHGWCRNPSRPSSPSRGIIFGTNGILSIGEGCRMATSAS